jgi:hypothetical protein
VIVAIHQPSPASPASRNSPEKRDKQEGGPAYNGLPKVVSQRQDKNKNAEKAVIDTSRKSKTEGRKTTSVIET